MPKTNSLSTEQDLLEDTWAYVAELEPATTVIEPVYLRPAALILASDRRCEQALSNPLQAAAKPPYQWDSLPAPRSADIPRLPDGTYLVRYLAFRCGPAAVRGVDDPAIQRPNP